MWLLTVWDDEGPILPRSAVGPLVVPSTKVNGDGYKLSNGCQFMLLDRFEGVVDRDMSSRESLNISKIAFGNTLGFIS